MKKIVAFVLSMLLLTSCFCFMAAAVDDSKTVNYRWSNTGTVNCSMTFDAGTGYAEAIVNGKMGVTSITGTVVVYKYVNSSWSYVTQKTTTVNSRAYSIDLPFAAEIGSTYKAEYTFTVYKSGVSEVITNSTQGTYQ